ncbi:transcriptional regulator [Desulfocarbo indianensis]|nr:transcriptional regulator [Desulfocarbo indianensis]
MGIDRLDKRIIAFVQGDLPLKSRPFQGLATELGISEAEVVARLQAMADQGVMRRFGATLRHQKSGFAANVMVAWRVPAADCDRVGERLASFRRVSHCYHREICDGFDYNLFSMVHGRSEEEVRQLVEEMAREVRIDDYALLFSREELKKTSMRYY